MGENLKNSLKIHEADLSGKLTHYESDLRRGILYKQKIIGAIIFFVFIIIIIFKSKENIPFFVLINSVFLIAFGLVKNYINTGISLSFSLLIYVCAVYLIVKCILRYYLDTQQLNISTLRNYQTDLLLYLLVTSQIISLFFIPTTTIIPDMDPIGYHFYCLSYFHPFIFIILLIMLNKPVKKMVD